MKVRLAPIITTASGTIGQITFERRRGGDVVRLAPRTTNTPTTKQIEQRALLENATHFWQLIQSSFSVDHDAPITRAWQLHTGIPWDSYRKQSIRRWLDIYRGKSTLTDYPLLPENPRTPAPTITNTAADQQRGQITASWTIGRRPSIFDFNYFGMLYYRADWSPTGDEPITRLGLTIRIGLASIFGTVTTTTEPGLTPGPWRIEPFTYYVTRAVPPTDPEHWQVSTPADVTVNLPPPVP